MILRRGTLLVLVALYVGVLLSGAITAPDRIALHWDASGDADRTGTTNEWLVQSAIIGLAVLTLGLGLDWLVDRFPASMLNLPNKEYWVRPENVDRARELTKDFTADILGDVLLLITTISAVAVYRAGNGDLDLPPALIWSLIAFFLVSIGFRTVVLRTTFARREALR